MIRRTICAQPAPLPATRQWLTIDEIERNTVQFYLAQLPLPVEYITFDNELFTVDCGDWRNLVDVALHPADNYISLLSVFVPASSFYTVYIQIIANIIGRFDVFKFRYMMKVLESLETRRRLCFARFCWKL